MTPLSLDSSTLSTILLAAGVVILLAMLFLTFRRRRTRSHSAAPSQTLDINERIERNKQIDATKDDLRSMMLELEELTRRFSAQLDAKSIKLDRLIHEADQRIATLSSGQRVAESVRPGEGSSPIRNSEIDNRQSLPPLPAPVSVSPDPLARSVYELADAGNTPPQIAQRLSEHVGKVELILALRQH